MLVHLAISISQDPKPLFVLPLLAYDLIETVEEDDKKKKGQAVKCAFEMRLNDERKKQDEPHILKADTEQWYSQWIEAIRNAKDEAVAIAESKRRRTDDGSTPLVFGRPLADAVSKADGSELPAIVTQTISYLEAHGMRRGWADAVERAATKIDGVISCARLIHTNTYSESRGHLSTLGLCDRDCRVQAQVRCRRGGIVRYRAGLPQRLGSAQAVLSPNARAGPDARHVLQLCHVRVYVSLAII